MTKLYVVPGSHPSAAVRRALELKDVPYEPVFLVPAFHKVFQAAKFGRPGTVPGIVFDDGRKVLGSIACMRALDERHPDPPLYPADAEAERWGEAVLQPLARRLIWLALDRDLDAQLTFIEGVKLTPPTPRSMARMVAKPLSKIERRMNGATDAQLAQDFAALPAALDRVDAWIADGILGGETAADLQVFSSLRLLLNTDDLKPLIDPRPAGAHARRLFPDYPGRVPAGALPIEPAAAAQPA